jgi:hypothetical protein
VTARNTRRRAKMLEFTNININKIYSSNFQPFGPLEPFVVPAEAACSHPSEHEEPVGRK